MTFLDVCCLLLMVVFLPPQLTTSHQVALSAIGYVGCSISIFCLAITLVTFAVLSWVLNLSEPCMSCMCCVQQILFHKLTDQQHVHVHSLYRCIQKIQFFFNLLCTKCFCYQGTKLMWCHLLWCRSVSTIRNQRYHIHANLSFAILVAEILLLISASFEPGTVCTLYRWCCWFYES